MHAVIVTVSIAAGQSDSARKGLHDEVLPRVKQTAGLVRGYWTLSDDALKGLSVVVFDTKTHADAVAQMVRTQPPPTAVTLNTVEVREVVGEA
jgi:hypothetical protein